jgi:hypothetical protein
MAIEPKVRGKEISIVSLELQDCIDHILQFTRDGKNGSSGELQP